jgi:hypothetical protein
MHKARDRPLIEFLHGFDRSTSEMPTGERLAEPLKFLHCAVPWHRIPQTSLVAQLLSHQDPLVFRVDRDSGARLRIRRLERAGCNWAGPTRSSSNAAAMRHLRL